MNKLFDSQLPIDLVMVYIAEAHAEDEWPIGSEIKILQHHNVEDRRQAAKLCIETTGFNWPCWIDSDEFEKQYAPWPIRFYIYRKKDNKVYCDWISEPVEGGYYNWPEIERKIKNIS